MTHQDHWSRALDQMVTNGTLTRIEDQYFPVDSLSAEDVQEGLISRFSTQLNEDIWEQYGKAKIAGQDVNSVIEEFLTAYADKIHTIISEWFNEHLSFIVIKSELRKRLDERYEY